MNFNQLFRTEFISSRRYRLNWLQISSKSSNSIARDQKEIKKTWKMSIFTIKFDCYDINQLFFYINWLFQSFNRLKSHLFLSFYRKMFKIDSFLIEKRSNFNWNHDRRLNRQLGIGFVSKWSSEFKIRIWIVPDNLIWDEIA